MLGVHGEADLGATSSALGARGWEVDAGASGLCAWHAEVPFALWVTGA